MKKMKVTLVGSILMSLTACGGGSSGSDTSSMGSPTALNSTVTTGSVSAMLNTSNQYRIIYNFQSVNGSGILSTVSQNSQGILTAFNGISISGNIVFNELSGNENYTEARIAGGSIVIPTSSTTSKTLDLTPNMVPSEYYFAYSPILAQVTLPTTKVINCTSSNLTKATLSNGVGTTYIINPMLQSGTLTIKPTGELDVNFTMNLNGETTAYYANEQWSKGSYTNVVSLGIVGQPAPTPGQQNSYGWAGIGINGSNSYVVGAIYTATLNSGAQYHGAMTMLCSF